MRISKAALREMSDDSLLARRSELWEKVCQKELFVMGTVQKQPHVCGRAGCCCMDKENPRPHGPYSYLAHRGAKRPGMLYLNKEKLMYAKKLFKSYEDHWEGLCRVSSINAELLRRGCFDALGGGESQQT